MRKDIAVVPIPVVFCLLIALFTIGCSSVPLKIPANPISERKYEKLGEGRGVAKGFLLFDLIPIGQNDRQMRAYDYAIWSKAGDALVNPIVQEQWHYVIIGHTFTTIVTGEVIRYVD